MSERRTEVLYNKVDYLCDECGSPMSQSSWFTRITPSEDLTLHVCGNYHEAELNTIYPYMEKVDISNKEGE